MPADFATRYAPEEQAVIFAHELVHLARQDARLNAMAALLRCVCWFNPLVHIGARLMRVDQELACDALALAARPTARAVYARALLKTQMASQALPLGCYWPGGIDHPLMERVAMLTAKRPGAGVRSLGACLVLLLTSLSGWSAWAAQPPRMEIKVPATVTASLAADAAMPPEMVPEPLFDAADSTPQHCV